jgi:hypothetical protein
MPWQLLDEKLLVNDAWTISSAAIDSEYIKVEFVSPQQTERVAVAAFSPEGDRLTNQIIRASLEPQVLEFKHYAIIPGQKIGFRPWNLTAQALRIKIYFWKSLHPATTALLARLSDSSRVDEVDKLIASLDNAGIWSKLDCFYLFGASVSTDGLLNWKGTNYACVPEGGTSYTVDRGFKGNGSTGMLNTHFNPSTANGNYKRDDAMLSVYSRSNVNDSNQIDIGTWYYEQNFFSSICSRGGNQLQVALNQNAIDVPVNVGDSLGLTTVTRSDASTIKSYKNGQFVGQNSKASQPINNASIGILAVNAVTYGSRLWSTRQIACAAIGASLDANQNSILYSAVQQYLSTIGASV